MDSVAFLLKVWGLQCQPGEFVALSAKGRSWSDTTLPYDGQLAENLKSWLDRNKDKNCYFCPLPFTGPRRSKELVARSSMFWSDIDDADPKKLPPSILWESSPGRHQGLWLADHTLEPDAAAEGSRKIAYYLGADKGGWDLTQVLRIPGTPNLKYPERPLVRLKYFKDTVLRKIPQSPIDRWRASIPRKLLRLVEGPAEQGKRSDMLWYLEHELCDLGIPIKDVFSILRNSDWNKYRGRADEDERFESEMEKIRADRGEKKSETRLESRSLVVVEYAQLLSSQASSPGWMIKDFWMRGSHGIVAGEPKSFKSTLAMDMLTSVAADKPFLDHPVHYGGPVLIVQNENSDWIMKDRQEKMAASKGEVGNIKWRGNSMRISWARRLPMFFVNQQGLMLDDAADKEALESLIDQIRPAAIKLDPLYLMFGGDINSAKDLNSVLQWCLYIKQTYNCAVILVHHYAKGKSDVRGGQRMLGSTTLHGWIESAWYLQVQEPENKKHVITLEREFRGAGLYGKIDVDIEMGDFGEPTYETTVSEHRGDREEQASQGSQQDVMDVLAQSTDLMSKTAVAKKTGMSRYLVDKVIDELQKQGEIYRKGERYGINRRKGRDDE